MKATANSQVKASAETANASGVRATAGHNVVTTVEVVTPEVAEQMLAVNTMNRPISGLTVQKYAADMAGGRWEYNGQDILFSDRGELLDGQHRLRAIISSGVPVTLGVKRGLPTSIFTTLDAGRVRSASDVLALLGIKYYTFVSSAARLAAAYSTGRTANDGKITRREVTDYAVAHPYLQKAARICHVAHERLNVSPVAAVIFLANERRFFDDQVAEFISGIATGEGLDRGDPRLTLREWAVSERLRNRGFLPTAACFAATARAWTAFARGEDLKLIKISRRPTRDTLEIVGFHAPQA